MLTITFWTNFNFNFFCTIIHIFNFLCSITLAHKFYCYSEESVTLDMGFIQFITDSKQG